MPSRTEQEHLCPVGEQDCKWLSELSRLRQKVNELTELVSHDPLTGLYNVRHFSEILPQTLERTRRNGNPGCLMLADLDHFTKINDNWGHEIGNIVLKEATRTLKQQVRIVDTVDRLLYKAKANGRNRVCHRDHS